MRPGLRGIGYGLAFSVAFWALLAAVVWLAARLLIP